ncbi:MAG TPA: hypothetical protein VFR08_05700 [Candidatus Angelobacter sp.]|nr:hypothetical protein [Candidatus Angelobacter sp.]
MKSRTLLRGSLVLAGSATVAYAACVATNWLRYGKKKTSQDSENNDALLDGFMPVFDVAERHRVRVAAPAGVTLASACNSDFQQSPVVRAIFRGRELLLGSRSRSQRKRQGLLHELKALGWGVLAEVADREIVMGTVTQPWRADVEFHPLSPDEFTAFHTPGYVKIAFTLRADPLGSAESIFRTETRVITTDPSARTRFRRYWSFLLPGILLIRKALLRQLKKDAEASLSM